jgi:hypothetical protein
MPRSLNADSLNIEALWTANSLTVVQAERQLAQRCATRTNNSLMVAQPECRLAQSL